MRKPQILLESFAGQREVGAGRPKAGEMNSFLPSCFSFLYSWLEFGTSGTWKNGVDSITIREKLQATLQRECSTGNLQPK